MAYQWIILLLVGYALASPVSHRKPHSEEEAARQKRREVLDDPNSSSLDILFAVNEEADFDGFDGDEKLTDEDKKLIDLSNTGDVDGDSGYVAKRAATHRDVVKRWPGRTVPYHIDATVGDEMKTLIQQAITYIQDRSCVQFVVRTNQEYYIKFVGYLAGCWSYVGCSRDPRGFQEISLANGCKSLGIVLHEIFHALGFWHEQTRPDRNEYVEIFWENIVDGQQHNFNKNGPDMVDDFDTPYDLGSLMQYGTKAFSKNGKDTLKPIQNSNAVLGQREKPSDTDLLALNKLYSCSVTDGGWSVWTSFSVCNSDCKKTRIRFCTNMDPSKCNPEGIEGKDTDTQPCTHEECNAPVNGHWGRWSDWSVCSKECGPGTVTRTRECDDPKPKNNGADCSGSNKQTENCQLKSCNAAPGDCSFDSDGADELCGWKQDQGDVKTKFHDWLRNSFTPSSKTGPQSGDKSGSGKFIYSEASDCLNSNGLFVRILSPILPATGTTGRCFDFWYYDFGERSGDFNVYVKDLTSGGSTKIFTVLGYPDKERGSEADKKWVNARIHHTFTTGQYQIVLESKCARSAPDYRGDFAVDEVSFTDGVCPARRRRR